MSTNEDEAVRARTTETSRESQRGARALLVGLVLVAGGLGGGCGDGGSAGAEQEGVTIGGCACPQSGYEPTLDCVCSEFSCPSYEEIRSPAPDAGPQQWRPCWDDGGWGVTEQVGCGKRVITSGAGIGGYTYVYDDVTLELIGMSIFSDVNFGACQIFSYQAGVSPSCDEGQVCSLCDATGQACAPVCSLEAYRQFYHQVSTSPSLADALHQYDCEGAPWEMRARVFSGCGRTTRVTAYGAESFDTETQQLLGVREHGMGRCAAGFGDMGEPCAEVSECSLCTGDPDVCQLQP